MVLIDNLIFLDTETTGLDDEDRLIQVAYKTMDGACWSSLFKPPVPIKAMAMAVNHITQDRVDGASPFKDSAFAESLKTLLKNPGSILVAHNAEFDIGMLAKEDVPVHRYICTQRVFQWMDGSSKLDSYKMQYLRYHYNIGVDATAHDALGDVIVLEKVFEKAVEIAVRNMQESSYDQILEKFISVSMNPMVLRTVPFGKHKGKCFSQVPRGYLKWVIKEEAGNKDMLHTARMWLAKNR